MGAFFVLALALIDKHTYHMSIIRFELNVADGRVDKELGTLKGVSVISTPEAKGHDIKIDKLSIESFAKATKGKKIKAYYTHSDENEALDSIGLWTNFQIVEDGEYTKLTADFDALDSWKEHHADDFDALFEMAEKAPEAFGVSAEFSIERVFYDSEGNEQKYSGEEDKELYARAVEVSAFSIVAQPAANPTGLFAEAKESYNFEELAKEIQTTSQKNDGLVVDLKIANETLEKFGTEIESKDAEIIELKKELCHMEAKYRTLVDESGADPVTAGAEIQTKSLEEQISEISSYSEKQKFIQANMSELVRTW